MKSPELFLEVKHVKAHRSKKEKQNVFLLFESLRKAMKRADEAAKIRSNAGWT